MNRALLALLGGVALATPAAASAGAPPIDGAAGVGDPFFPRAGNGGYQVRSYDIDLSYRPRSDVLRARTTIEATAGTSALRSFHLDFRGPEIHALKVNGVAAAFSRSGQELEITPTAPLPANAEFTVFVRYRGVPRPVVDPDGSREGWIRTSDGAIALGEPQGSPAWLPCNDHPTDKARFRIEVTTPRSTVGISNGELVERERTRRRTTTRWRQREPMATYLALVAIGRFRVDTRELRGIAYLAAADEAFGPGVLSTLRRRTGRAHALMRGVAGAYPFAATGGVVDPSGVGYALETQGRPYYPTPPSQDLVVHEIAHGWYGNSVSPASWDQIWLNEGFATYMEWLYAEERGGQTAARRFDQLYAAHGPGDGAFWNPPPAAVPGPESMFADSVYDRGAMALQVLREAIGTPTFRLLLRRWARRDANRYGTVTTQDLFDLIETLHGSVPPTFEDWLYDKGKPAAP